MLGVSLDLLVGSVVMSDPVSKALSTTALSYIRFDDIQAVDSASPVFPDIVLATLGSTGALNLLAAGELKTWWTVKLEDFHVTSPIQRRTYLEHHVGMRFKHWTMPLHCDLHLHRAACFVHAISSAEARLLINV